jgi:hypothetical protein
MYEILLTHRVRDQLRDAPPALRGHVTGISAVLRVDPTTASSAFWIRRTEDVWAVTFGAGFGFLTHQVLEPERLVVLLDLTWVG